MPFERIQANIDAGALYAVSVTASGYTSGQVGVDTLIKAVPTLNRCAEYGAMHVRGGALPFPELPRF